MGDQKRSAPLRSESSMLSSLAAMLKAVRGKHPGPTMETIAHLAGDEAWASKFAEDEVFFGEVAAFLQQEDEGLAQRALNVLSAVLAHDSARTKVVGNKKLVSSLRAIDNARGRQLLPLLGPPPSKRKSVRLSNNPERMSSEPALVDVKQFVVQLSAVKGESSKERALCYVRLVPVRCSVMRSLILGAADRSRTEFLQQLHDSGHYDDAALKRVSEAVGKFGGLERLKSVLRPADFQAMSDLERSLHTRTREAHLAFNEATLKQLEQVVPEERQRRGVHDQLGTALQRELGDTLEALVGQTVSEELFALVEQHRNGAVTKRNELEQSASARAKMLLPEFSFQLARDLKAEPNDSQLEAVVQRRAGPVQDNSLASSLEMEWSTFAEESLAQVADAAGGGGPAVEEIRQALTKETNLLDNSIAAVLRKLGQDIETVKQDVLKEERARRAQQQEARARADKEQEVRARAEQEARARAEQEQGARARAEKEARARAEQEARARAEKEQRGRGIPFQEHAGPDAGLHRMEAQRLRKERELLERDAKKLEEYKVRQQDVLEKERERLRIESSQVGVPVEPQAISPSRLSNGGMGAMQPPRAHASRLPAQHNRARSDPGNGAIVEGQQLAELPMGELLACVVARLSRRAVVCVYNLEPHNPYQDQAIAICNNILANNLQRFPPPNTLKAPGNLGLVHYDASTVHDFLFCVLTNSVYPIPAARSYLSELKKTVGQQAHLISVSSIKAPSAQLLEILRKVSARFEMVKPPPPPTPPKEKPVEPCLVCGLLAPPPDSITTNKATFHLACFKCNHCNNGFSPADRIKVRHNQVFHRECYEHVKQVMGPGLVSTPSDMSSAASFRSVSTASAMGGHRCNLCDEPILKRCVKVGRARWHEHCFVCKGCARSLLGGYMVVNEEVLCAECGKDAKRRLRGFSK